MVVFEDDADTVQNKAFLARTRELAIVPSGLVNTPLDPFRDVKQVWKRHTEITDTIGPFTNATR